MKGWTFVFDLDGTLVDTAPDLAEATNYVLATLGLDRVNELEIRPFVGHGALAMIDGARQGARPQVVRTRAARSLRGLHRLLYGAHRRPERALSARRRGARYVEAVKARRSRSARTRSKYRRAPFSRR